MKAKAVNYPSGPVVAFGGIEFVTYEWRIVPAGCEVEAERHPYLEVMEEKDTQLEAQPAPAPEPQAEIALKPKPRRRRTVKAKE
jgi:hypothetical protein